MPKLIIGSGKLSLEGEGPGHWFEVGDATFELTLNTSKFDDAMSALALDGEVVGCQARCKVCGRVQCIGDDPHTERFGPFHVFPEHDHSAK